MGVPDAAQGIGGCGGITAGDVDVSPVGGGDEPAVGASLSRVAGEGAACAKVLHGLPGAVRMEVLWAAASSRSKGKLVSSVGGRARGSLGKTERMEV